MAMQSGHKDGAGEPANWDHSSRREFYEYYATQSESGQTRARYAAIQQLILDALEREGTSTRELRVADIGCGAGTQSILWARRGHSVYGLDVNAPLVELARHRAAEEGADSIRFEVGTAVSLPLEDESVEVCIAPELLEHVPDWQTCLGELSRIVRPGGVLFLSTTNCLCPFQQEFNLPLYSWYPGPLKRWFEQLARTTRPQLANHATYPAVNWFSYLSLRRQLDSRGLDIQDRFDTMELSGKGAIASFLVRTIRRWPPLRWLAHVATPGTMVLAVKRKSA